MKSADYSVVPTLTKNPSTTFFFTSDNHQSTIKNCMGLAFLTG